MHEVTVKYKNSKSLKALQELAKAYDMVIEDHDKIEKINPDLPIRFSKNPDANALSGIWKDNPITPQELRKMAWGNRL